MSAVLFGKIGWLIAVVFALAWWLAREDARRAHADLDLLKTVVLPRISVICDSLRRQIQAMKEYS